jgi:hypothetical protein
MEEQILINDLKDRKIDYILIQKGREFVNDQALNSGAFRIVFENLSFVLYQTD